ncbi:DUF3626 domain-containing protein [Streptomyces sp. N35]|uniref:DUF3626 domain-containing protein n=1 Tax=Streptomyces sp. N35 TaxID=2795730 RepID=UPI0027DB7933|nr:DUF3626 domain-containing protein [Streptomyces sp. N35]
MSTQTWVRAGRAARALDHVTGLARGGPLDATLRVTLNFHPDRLTGDGTPILDAMAEQGLYSSQFVTGTSNGGLTAYEGGDRWRWESRIFGGAYDGAPGAERPVYGGLNFRRRTTGAAPRFGSAHLRLTAGALTRTTFCYPDSFLEPADFGVAAACDLIPLALADDQDALDDYIETQVHGPVRFAADAEALVLDPCFRGTEVEASARKLGCPVEFHGGFRISVGELARHGDYRGQEFVTLGLSLARDGFLDPALLGEASRSGDYDQQALKRVWHLLARFGAPAS